MLTHRWISRAACGALVGCLLIGCSDSASNSDAAADIAADVAPDISPDVQPDIEPDQMLPDANLLLDTDNDGLPDFFEIANGLDPTKPDSDNDGILDIDEDEDDDGLTGLMEYQASISPALQRKVPSMRHKDILIELDLQVGYVLLQSSANIVLEAFAALPETNLDGQDGIEAHIYLDQTDLPQIPIDDNNKHSYFASNGPTNIGGIFLNKTLHVMMVKEFVGAIGLAGLSVMTDAASIDETGAYIFQGMIQQIFPQCSGISADEAVAMTMIQQLGHLLQLGNDTSVGGGVNFYNIMSITTSCEELRKRARGIGNSDPSLGATQTIGQPRFSDAAAQLMKLKNKISADTKDQEVEDGYEM